MRQFAEQQELRWFGFIGRYFALGVEEGSWTCENKQHTYAKLRMPKKSKMFADEKGHVIHPIWLKKKMYIWAFDLLEEEKGHVWTWEKTEISLI